MEDQKTVQEEKSTKEDVCSSVAASRDEMLEEFELDDVAFVESKVFA